MPRYKINHRYSSGDHGPYEEGNEVELTEEEAAWLNHDSPGLLDEVDQGKQAREKRERNAEIAKLYERNKARDLPGNAGAVLADGPVRSLGGGDVSADGTATWDKDYGNPGPNPPAPSNDDVPAVHEAWKAGAEVEAAEAKKEEAAQKDADASKESSGTPGPADSSSSTGDASGDDKSATSRTSRSRTAK
jgi:hypothetical protein